ncbi:MAG: inositol monophosphatase [bacterium]|nr:inositol monophosphatase [bacterium]
MKIGIYTTVAVEAAFRAGEILKKHYRNNFTYHYKGHRNPVTEVDLLSQNEIKKVILNNFKSHRILAEEDWQENKCDFDGFWWVVDPLDGTVNFRKGFPLFCVSISLVKDGNIILGVIYIPITDELFIAERGQGSFHNDKRIFVSKTENLENCVLATGFSYALTNNPDPHVQLFKDLSIKTEAIRRAGSAAIDLAYTALGVFDGFWEFDLKPWDTAAGIILIEEANGKVSDYYGNPFSLWSKTIVASNNIIHEQIINFTKQIKL